MAKQYRFSAYYFSVVRSLVITSLSILLHVRFFLHSSSSLESFLYFYLCLTYFFTWYVNSILILRLWGDHDNVLWFALIRKSFNRFDDNWVDLNNYEISAIRHILEPKNGRRRRIPSDTEEPCLSVVGRCYPMQRVPVTTEMRSSLNITSYLSFAFHCTVLYSVHYNNIFHSPIFLQPQAQSWQYTGTTST